VRERETKWANLAIQGTAILSLTCSRVDFSLNTKTQYESSALLMKKKEKKLSSKWEHSLVKQTYILT